MAFERRHGVDVVIKHTTYDARLEADGLRALAVAGAPVPAVLEAQPGFIVIEQVRGRPDWSRLGERLAELHRHGSDQFGYDIDNVIGPLPQPNPWTASWGRFYAENRVRIHLEDPAVPEDLARRLRTACESRLPDLLDEHRPPASLVHGDLWAGNVVDGCWLIDPAVSFSDREVELAFMALFGGIPRELWLAYESTWPLPDGWQRRRFALQLHHLLVHVRLFGGGYPSLVRERLDALGW